MVRVANDEANDFDILDDVAVASPHLLAGPLNLKRYDGMVVAVSKMQKSRQEENKRAAVGGVAKRSQGAAVSRHRARPANKALVARAFRSHAQSQKKSRGDDTEDEEDGNEEEDGDEEEDY
jgi:hypothetical protein